MDAVNYKCPSCAASLSYDPKVKAWKCEYCSRIYMLNELKEDAFGDLDDYDTIDVDEYTCPNCGAKVITDENTTATFCLYCGSTAIIKNRLKGILKPKSIIPFKTTKQQAMQEFLNFSRRKPFAPNAFLRKAQIEKVTGIYIPFWLYDCDAIGNIEAIAKKVEVLYENDYEYTKTSMINIYRSGKADFIMIPVDASIKFDDATMDSIEPFYYKDMVDFSPAYLSGFFAEKYDVEAGDCYIRAEERINNALEEYLISDIDVTSYNSINFNNADINKYLHGFQYALLPVWMLNIKYNSKTYLFAMNGQTGKMIGNVPISPIKFSLWFLGIFIGFFTVALILLSIGDIFYG